MSEQDHEPPWPSDAEGPIGAWVEGYCLACSTFAPLPDLQLCAACVARWNRDLIRLRQWSSCNLVTGLDPTEREALRQRIVARFGEELEIFDYDSTALPFR